MASQEYYKACVVGGILACGLTHTAVTPLDVVKCNMQIDPKNFPGIGAGFSRIASTQGAAGAHRLSGLFLFVRFASLTRPLRSIARTVQGMVPDAPRIQCTGSRKVRALRVLQEDLRGYGRARADRSLPEPDLPRRVGVGRVLCGHCPLSV